jgi:hypothetical protein
MIHWAGPFTNLWAEGNQSVPLHRDIDKRYDWYQLEVSLGQGGESRLAVDTIGLTFRTNPGSVVAIVTNTLIHGTSYENADGITLYGSFDPLTMESYGLKIPGWMTEMQYRAEMGIRQNIYDIEREARRNCFVHDQ